MYIPRTRIVYALNVIPERNVKLFPVNQFIVVDETGEELINASRIDKIVIKNQTQLLHSRKNGGIQQMNLSNVTIVRTSFMSDYDWGRISFINQDIIMDRELNIIAARKSCINCFR